MTPGNSKVSFGIGVSVLEVMFLLNYFAAAPTTGAAGGYI
jgi:hypothetical protein